MAYAIKTDAFDPHADTARFAAQKTMYDGKHIAAGDTIYVFARQDDAGLVARATVSAVIAIPLTPDLARQTPRVDIAIGDIVHADRALTAGELRLFTDWKDGRPGTELNFKFYRQATNKIVGIADDTATFLDTFFRPRS